MKELEGSEELRSQLSLWELRRHQRFAYFSRVQDTGTLRGGHMKGHFADGERNLIC